MDLGSEIKALVDFRARAAGSYAERAAARHLEQRLTELGRTARLEATEVWPRWPQTYALLALAAVAGSVISVGSAVAGTAIVAVAAVLVLLEAVMLLPAGRRLLGRRASQNVVSEEESGKPGTLVLVAHYDTGRTGLLLRQRVGTLPPLVLAAALVLACAAARVAGVEGVALTAIQFVPTVALIAAVPLLLDVALSAPSPGANDNASGVAVALALADRHGGRLDHFDVWVVLTGGQEALAGGMRDFLSRRRRTLDRERTVFLNLDELGAGTIRYTRREGALLPIRAHDQLIALADEIAEDDADAAAFRARPFTNRVASDGYAARWRGYPALTVTCRDERNRAPHHGTEHDLPDRIEQAALERARGFCSELIERLDATVGPELG